MDPDSHRRGRCVPARGPLGRGAGEVNNSKITKEKVMKKFIFISGRRAGATYLDIIVLRLAKSTGYITIAENLYEQMGSPEYVCFFLDEEKKTIGIGHGSETDGCSRKIQKPPQSKSPYCACKQLLQHIGMQTGDKLIIEASYDVDQKMIIGPYGDSHEEIPS